MKRIINTEIIKIINLFENLTKARVKDCILNEIVVFVVEEGEIGKAIGKKGVNIKKITNMLNKRIKIAEFSNDVCVFVNNLLYPLEISNIYISESDSGEKIVNIATSRKDLKAKIIGRDSKNLKNLKNLVSRYFKIENIKVV